MMNTTIQTVTTATETLDWSIMTNPTGGFTWLVFDTDTNNVIARGDAPTVLTALHGVQRVFADNGVTINESGDTDTWTDQIGDAWAVYVYVGCDAEVGAVPTYVTAHANRNRAYAMATDFIRGL